MWDMRLNRVSIHKYRLAICHSSVGITHFTAADRLSLNLSAISLKNSVENERVGEISAALFVYLYIILHSFF